MYFLLKMVIFQCHVKRNGPVLSGLGSFFRQTSEDFWQNLPVYIPPKQLRWPAGTSSILSRCISYWKNRGDFSNPIPSMSLFTYIWVVRIWSSFWVMNSHHHLPTFWSMVYLTWKPIKKIKQMKVNIPIPPMGWGYRMSCHISCNFDRGFSPK